MLRGVGWYCVIDVLGLLANRYLANTFPVTSATINLTYATTQNSEDFDGTAAQA
jgi:hypothetical protein